MIKVAASVLAADILNLGEEIQKMEKAGCDWIHVDIMDGVFVPNLSYGPHVVKALKTVTSLPLDVHLMIVEPEKYIDTFIDSGADILTIHIEATKEPEKVLQKIKKRGIKAGITLKPGTDIDALRPFLPLVDMVLVMTVEPGFGGQSFMENMMKKVKTLRKWGFTGHIEVDGGIGPQNAAKVVKDGADVLVMGTALFTSENPEKLMEEVHLLK